MLKPYYVLHSSMTVVSTSDSDKPHTSTVNNKLFESEDEAIVSNVKDYNNHYRISVVWLDVADNKWWQFWKRGK